ncbi:MAG: Cys-tRNA(Pro) deacylase [Actinomycetaceae bacterium]|nr:Cys-tRNA(Pro) deacylase [Actinomycetaceae bacterium]
MAKKRRGTQNGSTATGTPALELLRVTGTPHETITVQHSLHQKAGYALDTAQVLGEDPACIFKTLMAQVDGNPVCAVVPANATLNLKSLAKAASGKHAAMLESAKAERLTGYVTGGISPLGQKTSSPVYIDVSAQELPHIYVSGGKRSLSVRLAPADLATLTHATFADIADRSRHF